MTLSFRDRKMQCGFGRHLSARAEWGLELGRSIASVGWDVHWYGGRCAWLRHLGETEITSELPETAAGFTSGGTGGRRLPVILVYFTQL